MKQKHVMHHKVHCLRRLLAAVLVAALFLADAGPVVRPVYAAAQNKEQTTGATTFVTYNQPEEKCVLSLRDGALYVDAFPTPCSFHNAGVYITNAKGTKSFYESKRFLIADPQPVPLPKEDGDYYLTVTLRDNFTNPGPVEYWILVKELELTVKDGKAFFPKSPVYENNLKFQKKEAKINAPDWYYKMQTFSTYFETEADKKAFEKELKKQAEEIVDAGDSDLVKIRKVHDWVAANIYYDMDDFYGIKPGPRGSEKDVLKQRRGVCAGYASLTAALLRALGIPAKVIDGYVIGGLLTGTEWTNDPVTSGGGAHAWTEAYVDGRWLIMDPTWDSTNVYKNGKYKEGSGIEQDYFDPSLELFSN